MEEEFSYVNGDDREQMVELSVEGKKQVVDIGDLIKSACSMIIGKVELLSNLSLRVPILNTNRF